MSLYHKYFAIEYSFFCESINSIGGLNLTYSNSMEVVIIYNPNSTGDGKANAQALARRLRAENIEVTLKQTTHAGHATEIAESYAKKRSETILISSSGDGGYHELINGVLPYPSSKLIVGLLPSGNANDHHTSLNSGDMAKAITTRHIRRIDTIKVSGTVKGKPWVRYAHSYGGFGVTAVAAKRLIEDRPNPFSEKWTVLHSLFSFRYVKVYEGRTKRRYSSFIFSNISTMSKVMKLSKSSSVTDGKFEITSIRFGSKLRLIGYVLTAATVGLRHDASKRKYRCTTTSPLALQLDGEVYTLDAGTTLTVESAPKSLRCVL